MVHFGGRVTEFACSTIELKGRRDLGYEVEKDECLCGDLVARQPTADPGARPRFRSPSPRPYR